MKDTSPKTSTCLCCDWSKGLGVQWPTFSFQEIIGGVDWANLSVRAFTHEIIELNCKDKKRLYVNCNVMSQSLCVPAKTQFTFLLFALRRILSTSPFLMDYPISLIYC